MRRYGSLFVLVILIPTVAAAGLIIQEKISTRGMMGAMEADGEETTYIEGDRIRTESLMKHGGMMAGIMKQPVLPRVTIIRLDKDLVWHLDSEDSTFMEMLLEHDAPGDKSDEESEAMSFRVKDIKVTETEKQKNIAGHKCTGLVMEMTFEVGAGSDMPEQSAEILFWMAPKTKQFKGIEEAWRRMMGMADGGNDMLQGAMQEISQKLRDRDGVPLGMELTLEMAMPGGAEEDEMKEALQMMEQFMKAKQPGDAAAAEEEIAPNQLKITREVISISEQDLEASIFEIPKGYTKTR